MPVTDKRTSSEVLDARIVDFLKRPHTIAEVVALLGQPQSVVAYRLGLLVREGAILRLSHGVYGPSGKRPGGLSRPVLDASILALLARPMLAGELARSLHLDRQDVQASLDRLAKRGLVAASGRHRYARTTAGYHVAPRRQLSGPREQPIRDAILKLLETPRRPAEIAAELGKTPANITGHLAAMKRLGLVVRLAPHVYGLPDVDVSPQVIDAVAGSRTARERSRTPVWAPGSTQKLLLKYLDRPRRTRDLVRLTKLHTTHILGSMRSLIERGLVVKLGYGRYGPGSGPAGRNGGGTS